MIFSNQTDPGIRLVELPAGSLIAHFFGRNDLADAFAAVLPANAPDNAEAIGRIILFNPARWFSMLLGLRDLIMRCFGVKTTKQLREKADAKGEDYIHFFKIVQRSPSEIILGDDDKHLDFRLSILIRPQPLSEAREVVISTVVQCHNWLGHIYLWVISPFHRFVVKSFVKRASRLNRTT